MTKEAQARQDIDFFTSRFGSKVLHIHFSNGFTKAIIAARWNSKATPFVIWDWRKGDGLVMGKYLETIELANAELTRRLEGCLIEAIFKEDPVDRLIIAAERFVSLYQSGKHEGESWGTEGAAQRRADELRLALDAVHAEEVG